MRGRAVDACGRLVASSRKLAPERPQILLLCAAVPRPVGLSCRRFDAWQLWYASCAARVPTNLGYEACLLQIAAGPYAPKTTYARSWQKQIALFGLQRVRMKPQTTPEQQ